MSGKPKGGKAEKTEEAGADAVPEKAAGGKKKLILIAVPVLLFGAIAGLSFSGVLPGLLGMRHEEKPGQVVAKPEVPVFVDLPDMIANLAGPSAKPSYVKLQARL